MKITNAEFPFVLSNGEKTTARLESSEYAAQKGSIALFIEYEFDEERENLPLTVFVAPLPEGCAALDRNNLESYGYWEQIIELIRDNELGEFIGEIPSGYCMYPVIKFNMDNLLALLSF